MLMAGATASAQIAYTNPVIDSSAPDPSVIRADDGTFYLYATENIRNTPIFHSADLVHWNLVGTAFTDETRPGWLPDGGIWAPDINKIGDDYGEAYGMQASEWLSAGSRRVLSWTKATSSRAEPSASATASIPST